MRRLFPFLLLILSCFSMGQESRHLWQAVDVERYGGMLAPEHFGTLVVFSADALGPRAYIVSHTPVDALREAGVAAFRTKPILVRDRRTERLSTVELRFPFGSVTLERFDAFRNPLRVYVSQWGGTLSTVPGQGARELDGWPGEGTVWTTAVTAPASARIRAAATPGLALLFLGSVSLLAWRMAFGPVRKGWASPWALLATGIGAVGLVSLPSTVKLATALPLPSIQAMALVSAGFAISLAIVIRSYRAGGVLMPLLLSVILCPLLLSIGFLVLGLAWPEVRWPEMGNYAWLPLSAWPGLLGTRSVMGWDLAKRHDDDPIVRRAFALAERAGVEIEGVWTSQREGMIAAVVPYRRIVLSKKLVREFDERELDAVICHEIGHLLPLPSPPPWMTLSPLLMVPALVAMIFARDGNWPLLVLGLVLAMAGMFLLLRLVLPLRRRVEFAADAWMLRLTGDPEACESMLRKLHESQKPDADDKWATHPNLDARLAAIRNVEPTLV